MLFALCQYGYDEGVSKTRQRIVDSGAMWLHKVLLWGFNDLKISPFAHLIKQIDFVKWEQLKNAIPDNEPGGHQCGPCEMNVFRTSFTAERYPRTPHITRLLMLP